LELGAPSVTACVLVLWTRTRGALGAGLRDRGETMPAPAAVTARAINN